MARPMVRSTHWNEATDCHRGTMSLRQMASLLLLLLASAESYRILLVLPTPTRSHYAGGARLLRGLVARGHELVVISPYGGEGNYSWIPIEVKSLADAVPELAEELVENQSFTSGQHILWRNFNKYARHATGLPRLREFIRNDTSHFDLVIVEEFVQSVFYMFAHKYRAPLVVLTTFGASHYISRFMGNALELAYVPHEFADYSDPLSFLERIGNIACTVYDLVFRNIYSLYVQDSLAKEVFGHLGDLPSLWALERNVSLALVNAHFTIGGVRPNLPNIVEVGGLHVDDPKPLTGKLRTLLDNAPNGVIVFSLGSITDLSEQPAALVGAVLGALERLQVPVALKWRGGALPTNANNLHVFPWLPQNDVLAHPNVILFITHGGLLSAQEAVHHAVPTVCVPLFGDQPLNCRRSQELGYGTQILPQDLTADSLYAAIQRVLTDPSYKRNVQQWSSRFRDRPSSALDTALYWVEYCARYKGMDFAKGPKRKLYWFQACHVDIAVFLLAVYKTVLYAKRLLRCLRTKNTKID